MKNKIIRRNCLCCGGDLYDAPLIKFKNMPSSAQNIPSEEELAQDSGIELELCQCKKCGLVQFNCEEVSYYKDVIRSGGFTSTMTELRKAQYSKLIEKFSLSGKKFIEVGCGRGEFLEMLRTFPVEVFGVEHNKSLVQVAKSKGLNVVEGFIGSEHDLVAEGPFDVFLSFNFLEHQPNPNGMLEGIYNNLTEEGIGLITVPSLEYILENDGYYEFIRDHIAYYTFETLEFLLNKNGFEIIEREIINRDTLSVIVKKRKRANITSISNSYTNIIQEINSYIEDKKMHGKKVALWGASHQGFTLAATAELHDRVEYIIDSAPFKQGKYSPSSHIPIISPADALNRMVDAIIIMAPGYTNEIADLIQQRFGGNIEIAVMRSRHLELWENIKCE